MHRRLLSLGLLSAQLECLGFELEIELKSHFDLEFVFYFEFEFVEGTRVWP